jgi:hypothetical protein
MTKIKKKIQTLGAEHLYSKFKALSKNSTTRKKKKLWNKSYVNIACELMHIHNSM